MKFVLALALFCDVAVAFSPRPLSRRQSDPPHEITKCYANGGVLTVSRAKRDPSLQLGSHRPNNKKVVRSEMGDVRGKILPALPAKKIRVRKRACVPPWVPCIYMGASVLRLWTLRVAAQIRRRRARFARLPRWRSRLARRSC